MALRKIISLFGANRRVDYPRRGIDFPEAGNSLQGDPAFKFINSYLRKREPGYAILITGPWGVGKTHFMNRFTEVLTAKLPVYVSLFGLEDVEDIDDAIGACLLKLPGGDVLQAGGGWLAELFDKDNASGLVGALAVSAGRWARAAVLGAVGPNHILILDDLDRYSGSKIDVLSVASRYAERQKAYVILVGDESLMADDEYLKVREKTIRHRYLFKPNVNLICQIVEGYFSYNKSFQEYIVSVWAAEFREYVAEYGCENIRILMRSMEVVEDVFSEFESQFNLSKDVSCGLLKEALYYGKMSSEVMVFPEDFDKYISAPVSVYLYEEYGDSAGDKEDVFRDYESLKKLVNGIPSSGPRFPSIWRFFCAGFLDLEAMGREINAAWYGCDSGSVEILLNYFSYSDAEQIDRAIADVLHELDFKKLRFSNLDQLFSILRILDRLSVSRAIALSSERLLSVMESYLDYVGAHIPDFFDDLSFFERGDFHRLNVFEDRSPNFNKIEPMMRGLYERARRLALANKIRSVESLLEAGVEDGWRLLADWFHSSPVLMEIGCEKLTDLCDSNVAERLREAHLFFMRRGRSFESQLFAELDVLIALESALVARWAGSQPTVLNEPRSWLLESLRGYIDRLKAVAG